MAKSPRAEQLTKVRDLIVLAKRKKMTSQKELELLAVKERIFAREDGVPWKHSRVFQYIDGLHWLGFNTAEKHSGQILLNQDGKELAVIGEENYKTELLSSGEKKIFARRIFLNDYVQDNFIRFFSPNQQPMKSVSEFKTVALPIYITNLYRKKVTDESGRSRLRRLCDVVTEKGTQHKGIESTEFLHTIRYWLRDLEIIDDLNISPRYRIELNYMVFPIKLKISRMDIARFEQMVRKAFQEEEASAPIPILLYRLCKRFYIPVEDAKMLIVTLFHEKPDCYYLNRAPEALLDIKYKRSYIQTPDGFWRNEMYLKRDGNE